MARNVDPTLPRFIQAGTRWEEFTIISDVHRLITHWDASAGRSRLCMGPACGCCQKGLQKLARFYLMLIDGQGRDKLLELRGRHMETLDHYEQAAGLVVRIRKEGTAKNSPISIEVRDARPVVPRDIARLVARFCLPGVEGEYEVERPSLADQIEGRIPNPAGMEDFE